MPIAVSYCVGTNRLSGGVLFGTVRDIGGVRGG